MIKKLVLALAVLICIPALASAQKFGYINTEAVFTALPEYKEMEATMLSAQKTVEDELANLRNEYQKKVTEFQNLPADTPDSVKQRRAQEIDDFIQKSEQFQQQAAQDLQQQQQKLIAPMREKIQQALQTVGDEGGYTMIFESAMPVYTGKDAVDVTSAVKAKLGL